LLEMIDVSDGVRSGRRLMLVVGVRSFITRLAGSSTFWFFLGDVGTVWFAAWNVMLTLWHGVWITGVSGSHLTASDDTSLVEPVPWGTDLTSIATHRTARHESAAASGISSGHESVGSILDTVSVVESLSGTESPA